MKYRAIRIHLAIATEVLKRKGCEASLYRLYVVAKALDTDRRGAIPRDELAAMAGAALGQEPKSIAKLLRKGDGRYWHTGELRGTVLVFLHRPGRIARSLGLHHAGRRVADLPLDLYDSIAKWRACLMVASLMADGLTEAELKARSTIARVTGVSESTQKRWERGGQTAGIYDDGRGRAPIDSPRVMVHYAEVVARLYGATTPELKAMAVRAIAGEESAQRRGFFTPSGDDLLRQAPHYFRPLLIVKRGSVPNKDRQSSSPVIVGMGSEGLVRYALPNGKVQWGKPDGLILWSVNGRLEAIPVSDLRGRGRPPGLHMFTGVNID